TGNPVGVRAPVANSGTCRRMTCSGGTEWLTRRNSETANVNAPRSPWTARMGASVTPSIGARISAGACGSSMELVYHAPREEMIHRLHRGHRLERQRKKSWLLLCLSNLCPLCNLWISLLSCFWIHEQQLAELCAFAGLGGTSLAGFMSKKPAGFSVNPMYAV